MIELLRAAADADRGAPAIIRAAGGTVSPDAGPVTFGDLFDLASRAATALRDRGIDRFAVVHADSVAAVVLMAGASLAGSEACLYAPDASVEAVADLLVRMDHEVLVTDRPDLVGAAAATVTFDELVAAEPAPFESAAVPAVRPHLVLTSGTTGAPRGVRHDWSRLLRPTERVSPTPGQRWLFAYGVHQFAGLQVLLHVLAARATLVDPGLRRPGPGLAAMRAHDVTHASATPTFWRFVLADIRSDGGPVPALEQLTMGGEAIPGPLIGQLAEVFPAAKISQVYAASEFGSSGSVRDARPGLPLSVLSRGDEADVAFKIVDGELWIRSRIGMLGYYGEPAPTDPDAWRATGDLVEVDGDRIVFVGRSSDIINVGGVKVHPLPVEEIVAAVPGVAAARVWGRPNAVAGHIVAVDIQPNEGADPEVVKAAVRDATAALPPASRPRVVRIVDALALRENKIIRRSDV